MSDATSSEAFSDLLRCHAAARSQISRVGLRGKSNFLCFRTWFTYAY